MRVDYHTGKKNKDQLSLTNPHDALHHGANVLQVDALSVINLRPS